ncbi:MAG: hypothetical protein ACFE9Z_17675, partial [Promethearchaeota archaeon]
MHVRDIKGRPKFELGELSGYFLWKQTDGFHLRWTTKKAKALNFQGLIDHSSKLKVTRITNPRLNFKIYKTGTNSFQWNSEGEKKINGIDFFTSGNLSFELRINNKKIKPKAIFIGSSMTNPKSNPFNIIQISEEETTKKLKIKFEKYKPTFQEINPEPLYE